MAQNIILKRSSLPGKVPDTGSLNAGELAINTYDGKIFIKRAGNVDSIQSVLTTNSTTTGSITLTQTGSFAELVTTQDGNIGRDLYVIRDIITNNDIDAGGDISGSGLQVNDTLNIIHGQFNLSASTSITGAVGINGDLTVLGAVNARQFNINVISSSIIYQSGSTKFGDTIDDSHQFTGSVDVSGSIILNGVTLGGSSNSGSFTGSFSGDGSGLRGVVSDDLPIDGWDYDSNSSASISDFNVTSSKYIIDFEWDAEMGSPVGHKTFISNRSGSTQVIPTDTGVKFVVGNNIVATIDSNGIQASAPAGTVSGSSQLTSSFDTRYVLSGSITQTTWDNIANKPSDIVSGSSQVIDILTPLNSKTGSYATTGSNTFVGTQILSGSILPAIDNTYDLGSATYQWRDIYVSSGSLYIDGTKVLGSTNQELQITTDEGQSIKILEAGSDSIILQSADGDIQLKTSGGGNLLFDPTNGLIDIRGTLQIQDGNKITSSGGNGIVFGNNIVVSGSIEGTGNINGVNISTFSSSVSTQLLTIQTNTGSSNVRLTNLENVTGSYATTGSNTFFGTQTFSGSLYVANDLIVQGSSSIQYISASSVSIGTNIVQLNTANPSVRYAGLSIMDSGSVGGSGSFLYDSVQDEFIFVHRGNGTNVTSSHFVLGPETYDDLGNETYLTNNRIPKGTGKEHLNDSQITDDGNVVSISGALNVTGSVTASAFLGTIRATNGVVSGSSQITFSGISSLPTLVSGSSQVDVMSTTNITRLATTGSNIFIGNQTITGSLYLSGSNNGSTPLVAFRASGTGTFQRGVQLLNPGMGNGDSIMYAVGKADNSKNMGQFYFHHAGDSSNNNRISVGLHSVDDVFNVMGSNEVLIGTTTTNSAGKLQVAGNIVPEANGTRDLGSASYRWSTVYTSDLSLNNGIGDWTIVEGEDDLFLYNNKKGKVYKFALTEVDPSVATPKKS